MLNRRMNGKRERVAYLAVLGVKVAMASALMPYVLFKKLLSTSSMISATHARRS